MPSWLPKAIGYGAVAVVVALIPQFVHGFRIVEFTYVGVYTAALVGLVILTGITGQISLGQGAFMALGAYTTAILSVDHGWPQLLTVPAGGLVAGIAGFLFGFPALRLSGVYLALATFALAVIIPSVAIALSSLTGGTGGILLALPTSPVGAPQHGRVALLRRRGDAWRSSTCSRSCSSPASGAARCVPSGRTSWPRRRPGVSLSRYKTMAFGVSAFYAGIAGSLFAILQFTVTPGSFPLTLSILLLAGLVVGGPGSLLGAIVGARLRPVHPELLRRRARRRWSTSRRRSACRSTTSTRRPRACRPSSTV